MTSEYVGQYGVKEGDVNKVWKITLKDNLKFDNGEAINAQSFVDSMKLLLNPEAANFRADTMWMYDLKIVGSEAYAKGGTYALVNLCPPHSAMTNMSIPRVQHDGRRRISAGARRKSI